MHTTKYGSCERKTKYESLEAASVRAHKIRPQMKNNRLLKTYKCKYCDGYHLTNMEQRKSK